MACKSILGICGSLARLPFKSLRIVNTKLINIQVNFMTQCRTLQTTSPKYDLMEFFDDKKNWGEENIQVGRAWTTDELRIKSNSDLHKLWYILLKERNMLFTMEEESKESIRLFPNPERIDKVQESMKNLETVVRERNVAYHQLETGETGEQPAKFVPNQLGLRYYYRLTEHLIPKFMNRKWMDKYIQTYGGYAVRKFLLHYREKISLEKRRARTRQSNHVKHLFKYFPDMDVEKLKMEYPDVNLNKARESKKARGHYVAKY